VSAGSSESQSPELAIRIVPPVASDGLWIPPASAAPPAPPPVPPLLPEPVVLGPPQAASATAATAPSASAVGATPEVVGGNELELEKIAALQPDVILGVYSFIDRATYERLSGIAPTVAPPSETVAATWQEQTRITGRALGLTERAEQVVADTEARFAEARAANPEFAGKTLAAGFVVGGETYALGTDDLRTQLFSDLGFTLPATSTTLSRELLGELDKDVLVVLGESRAAAEADQQLAALRVVRDGRVAYLGDFSTPFAGALGFGSPLSLPYALDIAVPALRSAVGGTPASI